MAKAVGALAILLFPNLAGAGLSEYHMRFIPSPSPSVAGYTMHLGTEAGDYVAEFDLGNPPSPGGDVVYGVAFLDEVDLFIAISAYDYEGYSSSPSNEVMIPRVVPVTPIPEPPTPEPPTTPPDSGGGDPGSGGDGGSGENPGSGGSGGGENPPPVISGDRVILGMMASELGEIMMIDDEGTAQLLLVDSLAASGDIRPAFCDLDGDGDQDMVLGFGAGSAGQVSVIYVEDRSIVSSVTLRAGSSRYRDRKSGMTYPSCGDIDGDGLSEIAIGFDESMGGRIQIFDDETTAFWPYQSDATNRKGYIRLFASGEKRLPLYPALGDVDGDGRDEMLVGTGPGEGARIFVLDDAEAGFAPHPSVASGGNSISPLPSPEQDWQENIERHVALGDVDGDGVDEVVVSFGDTGRGEIYVFDDLRRKIFKRWGKSLGVIKAGRDENRDDMGGTHVSLSDIDGDGLDEFIVGFDGVGSGEIQVFDDSINHLRPYFNAEGFVSPTNAEESVVPAPF